MTKTKQTHSVTWTEGDTNQWGETELTGLCACGEAIAHGWGMVTTRAGKPSRAALNRAWMHIAAQEVQKDTPMELMGKIIKTRVTNEVWIGHALGELPHDLMIWGQQVPYSKRELRDYDKANPWLVIIHDSKGWKLLYTQIRFREEAYARAVGYLHKAFISGHQIETVKEIDVDTLTVPRAALHEYLHGLAREANETTKPKRMVELLDEITDACSMLEILQGLKQKLTTGLIDV